MHGALGVNGTNESSNFTSETGMYCMVTNIILKKNIKIKKRKASQLIPLEEIMLSEISQAEKGNYHIIYSIYGT